MKTALRLVIGFTVLISFSLYLLETHLRDLCNQYRAGAYLKDWLVQRGSSQSPLMSDIIPDDKVIVMAKLEEEPTGWVQEQLPEYASPFLFIRNSLAIPNNNTRSDTQQLATRHLRRQPLLTHPKRQQRPPNPEKQRPRIHGLPHLHNRALRLPPLHNRLPPRPPLRIPNGMARRRPAAR